MKTVPLIFWSAVAYGTLLLLVRMAIPFESIPGVSLTGITLIVIFTILVRNLSRRSTIPRIKPMAVIHGGLRENPVQFLSGQIRVATRASDSYFDNVVRSRLKELLITKVTLETGLELETVRRRLSDPKQGPKLLRDQYLYRILYGPVPQTEPAKIRSVADAIDMIGAWKG